ncbi:MAG: hypothetical protein HC857_03685, partial [Synechococcales cyanobacterium RU_4_20]|nr:hypothetical protein [Synechococcales cyanobacterium RU_4_20]
MIFVLPLGYLIASDNQSQLINPDWKSLGLNLLMVQDIASVKPAVLARPYMDNLPLWSLSYEWWFYMLFYPIVTYVKSPERQSQFVWILGVGSTLLYVLHPNAILRVLMYLSIWWLGVHLSQLYRNRQAITVRSIAFPLSGIAASTAILLFQCWMTKLQGQELQFGVHPVLELRHFAFAIVVPLGAILWRKFRWIGFDTWVKPFAILAPISYVAYISHYYLVVKADYLSFLNHAGLEWLGCMGVMFGFSYVLELKVYPALRSLLAQMTKSRFFCR